MHLAVDTAVILFTAGLILLWALALGVWKYSQIAMSPDAKAHPYVDIAHRAALMYSFATAILAALVQFSAWSTWVDLTAASVVVFFFVAAIAGYMIHGFRRDTDNQFRHPVAGTHLFMVLLIVGEIGGTAIVLVGFAARQFF